MTSCRRLLALLRHTHTHTHTFMQKHIHSCIHTHTHTGSVEVRTRKCTLQAALQCLAREDPSLVIQEDPETGQTLMGGMGELHLEVAATRLERQFGCAIQKGKVAVA